MEQDSLQHYGVLGMKWGRRRAGSAIKKSNKLAKESTKLEKRLIKEDKKAAKTEVKIDRERQKVEGKLFFTINRKKRDALNSQLEYLDLQTIRTRRRVEIVKGQIERNDRMRKVLDGSIDSIAKKIDAKYFEEMLSLNPTKDASKIQSMAKEKAKIEETINNYKNNN